MKKNITSEMTPLHFLLGKWNTTGKIFAKDGSAAGKIKGTDSYRMILDGHFIIHKVDVKMNNERIKALEIIGGYDAVTKRYKMRSFDDQGVFIEMEAYIDENLNFHIIGDKMRSTLSISNKNTLKVHWENSEDNKSWQPWMELTLAK